MHEVVDGFAKYAGGSRNMFGSSLGGSSGSQPTPSLLARQHLGFPEQIMHHRLLFTVRHRRPDETFCSHLLPIHVDTLQYEPFLRLLYRSLLLIA